MNAFHTLPSQDSHPNPTPSQPAKVDPTTPRHIHRERAFGVGYGNSSGYASPRRYADSSAQPRFRCV